ncbi:MAG: hypothetical protein E6I02_05975 [Chloroflexi bacterium]|nr:MAG: hypothetical protein E6I02_05975 [Chloroflexota bacterium]
MSDKFPATQLRTAPHPGLVMPRAPATPAVAPGSHPEERFAGPTIAQDLVVLGGLYRDLLALAVWRRLSARFPEEAREVNS